MSEELAWAFAALQEMAGKNAYGHVMVNFQDGKVINLKIEETRKPEIDKATKKP